MAIPKWQIELSNPSSSVGDLTVTDFPEGFDNIMYGLNRDSIFWGVFSEFAGTLRFIGDGKDYFDDVVNDLGYENQTTILFKKYDEDLSMYVTKKTAKVDFSDIKILRGFTEVSFSDSAFITKLRSRYDYQVEFNKSTTIDGTSLPGFSTPYVDLTLRGIAADSTTRAIFVTELFTSIIQQITDSDYECFESLIFDRDIDGILSGLLFANGYFIRGYDETERKFNISLKFLFEELSKKYPLGLKIIYDSSDREVVYIGKRSEMFSGDLVFTFDKDRELQGMVKEPCKEFMFNRIVVGSTKGITKDNDLGNSEYNVKAEYSTPLISFIDELNIAGDLRIDGTAIEDCRVNYYRSSADDTSESEYDKDIFMIDSIYDTDWKSRELEDIQNSGSAYIYGNIPLYMNIRFTPAHNVLAYKEYISIGLQGVTSEQLKILLHEKLSSTFQSQYLDDPDVVYENANIDVTDLGDPIFSPHIWRFRCPMEFDEIADIEDVADGVFKFYSYLPNDKGWKYGYLEKDISTSPIDTQTNVNLYVLPSFDELVSYLLLLTGGHLNLLEGGFVKLFDNG